MTTQELRKEADKVEMEMASQIKKMIQDFTKKTGGYSIQVDTDITYYRNMMGKVLDVGVKVSLGIIV